MDEDIPPNEDDAESATSSDSGDAFEFSQMIFVVGHVASNKSYISNSSSASGSARKTRRRKVISVVYRMNMTDPGLLYYLSAEKTAKSTAASSSNTKDGEELDQVAGNAEDEIGERNSQYPRVRASARIRFLAFAVWADDH